MEDQDEAEADAEEYEHYGCVCSVERPVLVVLNCLQLGTCRSPSKKRSTTQAEAAAGWSFVERAIATNDA